MGAVSTLSMSGELRVRMQVVHTQTNTLVNQSGSDAAWFISFANTAGYVPNMGTFNDFDVKGWFLQTQFTPPGGDPGPINYWYAATLEWPGGGAKKLEGSRYEGSPPASNYSNWYAFEETFEGLRLGRRRVVDPDLGAGSPHYLQKHWVEQYAWFGDQGTRRVMSMAGWETTLYLRADGTWALTPSATEFVSEFGGFNTGALVFEAYSQASNTPIQFRNLSFNGYGIDTTGLNSSGLVGDGAGGATLTAATFPNAAIGRVFAPVDVTFRVKPSLFYRGNADREDAVCVVTDNVLTQGSGSPSLDQIDTPYEAQHVWQRQSWTVPGQKAHPTVIGPWYLQSVEWNGAAVEHPQLDKYLGLWTNPGPSAPSSWPAFFYPVTVTFGDVDVAAVDAFSQVDATTLRLTIGERATLTPEWRTWLYVNSGGWTPEKKDQTKHTGDYAWGWGSHGYLDVSGTRGGESEADSAKQVTLKVYGVRVSIFDNYYLDGILREEAWTITETEYTAEYDFEVGDPGAAFSERLDLILPDRVNGSTPSGDNRQFYHGRVDQVELISRDGKELDITGLLLTLKAVGPVYLKVGYGYPVNAELVTERPDYSSLGASNGGSCPAVTSGDSAYKAPEDQAGISFQSGGNLRYVEVRTALELGEERVADRQFTLEELCALLDGWEGFTVTYDRDAADAANTDAYGASLVEGAASWMTDADQVPAQCWVPLVPDAQFNPGEAFQPECHWVCAKIELVAGFPFVIGTHQVVGAAIEALVDDASQADGRAAPGTLIQAEGYPDSVRATDAHGLVRAYPVPQGATAVGLVLP